MPDIHIFTNLSCSSGDRAYSQGRRASLKEILGFLLMLFQLHSAVEGPQVHGEGKEIKSIVHLLLGGN